PADAIRVRNDNNKDTPLPPEIPAARNPPAGAVIDYWLGPDTHGPVTLAIYDSQGKRVRAYASNAPSPTLKTEPQYFTDAWLSRPESLAAQPGVHRVVWDLRYPRPDSLRYSYGINAIYGVGTAIVPRGPLVLPGRYRVELTVNGRSYTQPLVVTLDPRAHPAGDALQKQLALALQLGTAMHVTASAFVGLGQLHAQLTALAQQLADKSTQAALLSSVNSLDGKIVSLQTKAAHDHNFATINARLTDLATQINDGDRAPPASYLQAFRQYEGYAQMALKEWLGIQTKEVPALNRRLVQQGLTPLKL
ncbi:MAG: hypothetical protein KGL00_05200, partial [Gammaproteobacteria bacterium]|nr:hypothetical protein [Gammaproteobacteria bacterium]